MRLKDLNFRKIGLQAKIFAAIIALQLAACLLIIAAIRNLLPPALIEAGKEMGILEAQGMAARSLDDILTDSYDDIRSRLAEEKRLNARIEYIFIMNDSFDVIAHSFSGGFPFALKGANPVEAHQDSSVRLLATHEGRIYDIAVPVKLSGDILGYVRIGLSDRHIRELSDRTIGAILWIGVSTVLIGSYLSFLLAGGIGRPIETMHRISEDIMMGDFSRQIKTPPVPCAEFQNCGMKDCPAYGLNHLPCWCVSGTLCEPVTGKDYAQKIDYCRTTCPVYKKYSGDAVQQLAETFNLLSHRLNQKFNQLRESEKSYRELFEIAPVGLFRFDISDILKYFDSLRAEGVTDIEEYAREHPGIFGKCEDMLKPIDANRAVVQIYKAKDKREILENWNKVFGGESYPLFVKAIEDLLKGRFYAATECVTSTLKGDKIYGLLNWRVSRRSELIIAIQNMTLQKAVENKLRENYEKLRSALEVKSVFSAMVSHEMRTPLTAIKESLDLMGAIAGLTADQKKMMRIAESNADRLYRLISDVLEFSQLENGRMKFNFSENSLCKALDEASACFKSSYAAQGLYLKKDYPAGIDAFIFDYDKILEVLFNLLGNALKWTAEGGIILSASEFYDSGKQLVRVSVKDSGCGLRKGDLDVIFEQYVKQPGGSYIKPGGAGLGLSISKEIVLAHGGRIWAESAGEGSGSEIIFTLPKPKPAGESESPPSGARGGEQ